MITFYHASENGEKDETYLPGMWTTGIIGLTPFFRRGQTSVQNLTP